MKYSPTHQKKQVSVAVWTCIFCAVVSYGFSLSGITSPLPLQLIAVISLCGAAYLLVRYLYTSVTYELRPRSLSEDSIAGLSPSAVDFAVHRAQGKRENLEFLMALSSLRRVETLSDGTLESLRRDCPRGMKLYYYTVDLVPRERLALLFEDSGEYYCLVIARFEKLEAYLREACIRNNEQKESEQ